VVGSPASYSADYGYESRLEEWLLSLCLTKHYSIKTYWGSGSIAPRILDLGTRGEW
jgi:hypothetical protein